ncbi:LysR family transcriptional regulator [Aromatoleum toluclasticum]|uniref:LysR family transcriptional regulator n=1 Tax=Aromatoleum toluclasticum TaxID=92003 RepID=UPI00035D4462|nr:LysR family transcriptional regulator [Aromatoleum toluclasticum]MCC4116549.1 LysR family transcriptional regulator [Aromatoleum toluclasticum]
MRFEIRHMRAFIAVAEELQFRPAAERLHMTQSALTRTIQHLEEAVGAELLSRTTRVVHLTDAGRTFLYECRLALGHIEKASLLAQAAADGKVGYLRIAYMDFAINGKLPMIIERFLQTHPGIKVELFHFPSSKQKEALLESRIDVGFLIGPFESPSVRQFMIEREDLVVLLPAAHPLAAKPSISIRDLANEKFILGSKDSWEAFRTHFFALCHAANFSPLVAQEASTSDGIFGLVAANIGVALYARCAENIQRKGLVIRPLAGRQKPLETMVCWRKDIPTPTVERFAEFLHDNADEFGIAQEA